MVFDGGAVVDGGGTDDGWEGFFEILEGVGGEGGLEVGEDEVLC